MEQIKEEGLSLSVNDSSLQSKIRQMRGRRRALAPLLLEDHEKFVEGEVYETLCAYQDWRRITILSARFNPGNSSPLPILQNCKTRQDRAYVGQRSRQMSNFPRTFRVTKSQEIELSIITSPEPILFQFGTNTLPGHPLRMIKSGCVSCMKD